ncbi:hypothetical protein PQJ75_13695 [Rhodoplanes sp. TEM]|uniref:Uncharacterized protein n=1 Tax=Rhodoplanes tepidamans TaxID=200616 RepID=A0ABT5JCH8_RHOTP|nr:MULTISPECIES: hypothetical protein [Rhodoplanes]MDC7787334.1 hypothetical protein [Rhodoplanes tepidamans]MDC7984784.1 hypothetical protein [Rhodoplanes sp. TEM]MDQ0358245.1 hypothetical protein [Rhodoplanes tepidamans]
MIPAPPLSENLLRLAHWFTSIRNGVHAFTPDGMEAFEALLHGCADEAERLEAELREARTALLDDAARSLLSERIEAAVPQLAFTTAQLDTLLAVARGEVPNVVLFPKPHRLATGCVEVPFGGDAA